MSDTARKERMRPDHLLLAGSVGKTLAAAVALQLVQEGTLDLDAKVSTYLGHEPWYARLPNAADVTVRQLMTHTSGVVRYEFDERFLQDLVKAPYRTSRREALSLPVRQPRRRSPPAMDGSTTRRNYILLGATSSGSSAAVLRGDAARITAARLAASCPRSARHPRPRAGLEGPPTTSSGGGDAMVGAKDAW